MKLEIFIFILIAFGSTLVTEAQRIHENYLPPALALLSSFSNVFAQRFAEDAQYARTSNQNFNYDEVATMNQREKVDRQYYERVDSIPKRTPIFSQNFYTNNRIFNQDYITTNVNLIRVPLTSSPITQNLGSISSQQNPSITQDQYPERITFVDEAPTVPAIDGTSSEVNLTSKAITGFGLDMIRVLNGMSNANLAISPYSIAALLALLQQGAKGDSKKQITDVLHMTSQVSSETFKDLLISLKKRGSRNILKLATNMYVNDAFVVNTAFKNKAVQNFGSEVTSMNFNAAQAAARTINKWVADKTQYHIPELISSDDLSDNTQIVLANAIFFKGLWQNKFNINNTSPGDFHLPTGEVKRVPFMRAHIVLPIGYDTDNQIQHAILPFDGEQYKLMTIKPADSADLNTMIEKLTPNLLQEYLMVSKKDAFIDVPKFTVRGDINLRTVLIRMGIQEVFGAQSDLFDIGTYRNTSPQISSAVHKAVLSIDEQGGIAAAATAFTAVALSYDDLTIKYTLDKPFLVILWDAQNSVPLFIAKINDPTQ